MSEPNIVDELARQIAEDMVPICNATCESNPDAIVETLLSRETVRPILDKLRNGQGSRVNFKDASLFRNPVLFAKIGAVKSIPTNKYVEFLNSHETFVNMLRDFTCASQCDVDKLTNNIINLVLEPYRANIIELFELRKSAGGHKHRGHKQKSRRGHKNRGHKSRRGHKTRRHRHRRSTRKH